MSLQRHVPGRSGSGHLGSSELGSLLLENRHNNKPLTADDLRAELQVFAEGPLTIALHTVATDIQTKVREDLAQELAVLQQQMTSVGVTKMPSTDRSEREQARLDRRSRRLSIPPAYLQRSESTPGGQAVGPANSDDHFETETVATAQREPASPKSVTFDKQNSMRRKSFALSVKTFDAETWEDKQPNSAKKSPHRSRPSWRRPSSVTASSPRNQRLGSHDFEAVHLAEHDRTYQPLMALSTVVSEGGQDLVSVPPMTPHTPARKKPLLAREVYYCCQTSNCCWGDDQKDSVPLGMETASDPSEFELPVPVSCRERMRTLVESATFEYFTGVLVVLNALALGLEVDCAVSTCHPHLTPAMFNAIDGAFCLIFVFEIMLRLFAFGRSYFSRRDWQWNVFDLSMVLVQIMDQARYWFNMDQWVGTNYVILRTLRLIRLVRVARIYRVIRLFQELHVIVSSMASAAGSLVWSLLLQVVTVYVWGLFVLQIVSASEDYMHDEHLQYWFGSLGRSMLTMFECVLSGVSWDSIVSPLMREVSPIMGVLFVLYIAVSLFAMMNLVTGLFVAEVTNKVREDKDETLAQSIRELFKHLGKDDEDDQDGGGGVVTREEFLQNLRSEAMQTYLKSLDVHPSEASLLFDVLDVDGDLLLKRDEMLNAFLRLRGPAKALDIAILRRELADIIQQAFGNDVDDMTMQGQSSLGQTSHSIRQSWHSSLATPLLPQPMDHRMISPAVPPSEGTSRAVSTLSEVGRMSSDAMSAPGARPVTPSVLPSVYPRTDLVNFSSHRETREEG
mmetsp:Transcript_60850/g.145027  ORF Transcript_60850/g.145027 Transcript_60850/m.145027 type:complete len:790 (+) Transcript_60850:118-2487(+)